MTYTDAWPHSIKDLVVFGNKNIEHGTNWFRPVFEKADCNIALIALNAWLSLKVQVNNAFWDKYNKWHLLEEFADVFNGGGKLEGDLHLENDPTVTPVKVKLQELLDHFGIL